MDLKALRENLIILRTKKGLSQEALAEKAGVTKPTIQNIESARLKKQPRASTLKGIADALEVDVYDLTKKESSHSSVSETDVTVVDFNFDLSASVALLLAIVCALITITICSFVHILTTTGGILLVIQALILGIIFVYLTNKAEGGLVLSSRTFTLLLLYGALLFTPFQSTFLRGVILLCFMSAGLMFSIVYLASQMRTGLKH